MRRLKDLDPNLLQGEQGEGGPETEEEGGGGLPRVHRVDV